MIWRVSRFWFLRNEFAKNYGYFATLLAIGRIVSFSIALGKSFGEFLGQRSGEVGEAAAVPLGKETAVYVFTTIAHNFWQAVAVGI